MVRVLRLLPAVALAQPHLAAAIGTLRGVPDLVELHAVDGGVYAPRQHLVATYSGDDDCEQTDWEPAGECDGHTLTQMFKRRITRPPTGNGRACEMPDTMVVRCKPVHCEMGPWTKWSACDENGEKTRTRENVVQPQFGGRACPHDKDVVKCRKQDCRVCAWSDWVCNAYNGMKTRTRHITRDKELDGADCPPLEETEVCDPVDCVYLEDEFTPWTECNVDTGEKSRHHVVVQEPLYKGKACPADEIDYCPPVDCEYEKVATNNDQFGECEADEGNPKVWHRHKIYLVAQEKMYGGKECDPALGDITELCEPVQCEYNTPEDSPGDYGQCEEKANGEWFKYKPLTVKTEPLYGADPCDESKAIASLKCDPINCEYETEANSLGEYGACSADDGNVYHQYKELDIKTKAQYGGKECNPDDKWVSKVCPPVHCEYKSAEDSSDSYGECTYYADENVWKKKKKLDEKQAAANGGDACPGDGYDYQVCDPVPCTLGPWGVSTDCNYKGETEQFRAIVTAAMYGGTCDAQTQSDTCTPVDCAVAGESENEDDWGACQDDGFKYKVRRITRYPRFGGAACPDEAARTVKKPCEKVDCVVGDWGKWSECDANGERKREREKVQDAAHGGAICPALKETESCLSVPCVLEDWSKWGACKNEERSRTRDVQVAAKNPSSETCSAETETDKCEDCVVGDWGKWGECKELRNGKKKQTRSRPVLQESARGGKKCPTLEQSQFCGDNDCHVGDWKEWGACKNGEKTRHRDCHPQKYGGEECDEHITGNSETVSCHVDCVVSPWSDPTKCDADGKMVSERKVLVEASGGGTPCPEELRKEEACTPMDCVLDDWSAWGDCDEGTNSRTRTRAVLKGPKHGGAACPGKNAPTRKQTEQCLKRDCVVSDWCAWSTCSVENPTQTRSRTTIAPVNGGAECPTELTQTRDCAKVNCRSEWKEWGACVGGKKERSLEIVQEAEFGGDACPTVRTQTQDCVEVQ